MKLKIKDLKWYAGAPVAMISEGTAKKLGVRKKDRIEIKTSSKELVTVADTVGKLLKDNEIAVSEEIKRILELNKIQKVDINLASSPKSLEWIKKKLNGHILSRKEIKDIMQDIVKNSLSEPEIAIFVSGMYQHGMNIKETEYLIEGIIETGNKLNLKNKIIADKHSIGGIPGRVTPLVVSICAAVGLIMPKTSSRAITTPSGTADAMETLCEVEFCPKEVEKIIKKTGGCIVWGGGLEMVPADSKIIQVEKLLGIDPEAQLLASIMSKKLASGSNHIVIHIPYGKYAKVDKKKAERLKLKFRKLAKKFNLKLECTLSYNKGPFGSGVGPVLEMIDVIKILNPKKQGPLELKRKAVELSGELLELTKKVKNGKGKEKALEILNSGKAFEKFKQIIKAQKGNIDFNKLKPAKYKKDIFAKSSFKLREVNTKKINSLARMAGCPVDKKSGLYLYFHEGDEIKKGEKIMTIYSESKKRLKEAEDYYKRHKEIFVK